MLEGICGCALGLGCRVGESKDDGRLVVGRHLLEDLLREDTGLCARANQRRRLDAIDDRLEIRGRLGVLGKALLLRVQVRAAL